MSDTIEIEVTDGVKEQYDELVDEYGERAVQTDLLQAVIPSIRQGHQHMNQETEVQL